jgi:2-C-methyl-D-erythritol 2,4-cyclodiphosphate synthase
MNSASESAPTWPRIGLGMDRHRLIEGRACRLGGIEMDCPVGPLGHSDGDAILHALADALLGAAGLDDLGTLFPDTDPQWKDAASVDLLVGVLNRLAEIGLRPASIDLVAICDRPKIGPYRLQIRQLLSQKMGLSLDRINLKGKTREGVDDKVEFIDVTAIALLIESSK